MTKEEYLEKIDFKRVEGLNEFKLCMLFEEKYWFGILPEVRKLMGKEFNKRVNTNVYPKIYVLTHEDGEVKLSKDRHNLYGHVK